jgi:hypothetical protein
MRALDLSIVLASSTLMSAALLAGCGQNAAGTGGGGGDGGGGAGGASINAPTFHKDVEPILQKSCQSCHSPGSIAPFSLVTYEDAQAVAGLMKVRTSDRTMPPWGAFETDECKPTHPWRKDLRLSDQEIATIAAWSAAGAPEGNKADAPPPIELKGQDLPGMTQEVHPQKPFVASGDSDQFRCFVLDPALAQDSYLNGWNFVAGNPKVVHHALLFVDSKNESAALADADGQYDCFGGPNISGALVAAWAPGGVPFELEPNIGTRLPKGSKLVMQIHYHPAGTTADPDTTKFQMRFTAQKPEYELAVALIGNFAKQDASGDGLQPGPDDVNGVQFLIPAGAKAHTETERFTLPDKINGGPMPELHVYGAGTHMHYVGRDMLIQLEHKNPKSVSQGTECLIQTPDWNFAWQRSYQYDAKVDDLPLFLPGDVLHMRCTYDNTMDNPYVQKALKDQKLSAPVDVKLGESTLDEMCLAALPLLYKAP